MPALTSTSSTSFTHKGAFTFKLHNYYCTTTPCGDYKMDGYCSNTLKERFYGKTEVLTTHLETCISDTGGIKTVITLSHWFP